MITTVSAECPRNVTITTDSPPHAAGDEMMCTSNGYPAPTYEWTVDGIKDSTASTQALVEGEHVYVCKATSVWGLRGSCSATATLTVTAGSKYTTNNF